MDEMDVRRRNSGAGRSEEQLLAIGAVALVLGVALFVGVERGASSKVKLLSEVRSAIFETSARSLERPGLDGKLVHAVGRLTRVDGGEAADPLFEIRRPTLRLERRVTYFQWVEQRHVVATYGQGSHKRHVYEYSYERQWVAHPVDSGAFQTPDGHRNHIAVDVRSQAFEPQLALGRYTLPPALSDRLEADRSVEIDMDAATAQRIEAKLGFGTPRVAPDVQHFWGRRHLYFGQDFRRPSIGDVRVEFYEARESATVTVMARVEGETFAPYVARDGQRFWEMFPGPVSSEAYFDAELSAAVETSSSLRKLSGALIAVGLFLLVAARLGRRLLGQAQGRPGGQG